MIFNEQLKSLLGIFNLIKVESTPQTNTDTMMLNQNTTITHSCTSKYQQARPTSASKTKEETSRDFQHTTLTHDNSLFINYSQIFSIVYQILCIFKQIRLEVTIAVQYSIGFPVSGEITFQQINQSSISSSISITVSSSYLLTLMYFYRCIFKLVAQNVLQCIQIGDLNGILLQRYCRHIIYQQSICIIQILFPLNITYNISFEFLSQQYTQYFHILHFFKPYRTQQPQILNLNTLAIRANSLYLNVKIHSIKALNACKNDKIQYIIRTLEDAVHSPDQTQIAIIKQIWQLPSSSYEFLVEVSLLITSKRLVSSFVLLAEVGLAYWYFDVHE
ncbi:Hypothetical_protein [Hexamita inflata]|uniref:Hypothetical_protein n=1 Tax=Hexamita inflata TaxID=28002 RepID=A0AA86VJ88_9EUKA|nr:Hypothetical protein HINF_LOCUS55938 [Hexamita inflata]